MSIDDVKKRFVEEVKLRAYDDRYVDKNEEREILQVAIAQDISIDSARFALLEVCEQHGYILESSVQKQVKAQVETAFGDDGKIDRKAFDLIFQNAKRKMGGKRNDIQIKRMIVEIMEDSGMNKIKTGWFSNWYATMKKGLGM